MFSRTVFKQAISHPTKLNKSNIRSYAVIWWPSFISREKHTISNTKFNVSLFRRHILFQSTWATKKACYYYSCKRLRACLFNVFKNCFLFLKQKTPKTRLVERVIFVFVVPRVLKMTLFREQQNVVFPVFLLFTKQN